MPSTAADALLGVFQQLTEPAGQPAGQVEDQQAEPDEREGRHRAIQSGGDLAQEPLTLCREYASVGA